ncbi:DUF3320 domain-containing protein [Paenibacillus sp. FSL H8-0548]|uniref:DUF3320 domain-containing protein n=1 Tax=Paenibacillus sp. FSL H8-0548 TaxID=1920422 RepID=UPI0009F9D064|nr:DUF3320 domain-containing protein [Paenibacillus sp. FSL H8-0548]
MNQSVRCEWEYSKVINYAMQQNHVPIVRKIVLTNVTEEDIRLVTVKLSAEPAYAYEWTKVLDVLPAGQSIDLGVMHVQLLGSYLAGLSERVTGLLTLSVIQNEKSCFEERASITILAFDEWSGLAILPEMAASFVTPNHSQVLQVVREAASTLGKWNGSPTFSAYQSKDPNRARLQAAAIYSVIQSKAIAYCVAPPSFEQIGQRVRLLDTIFAYRLGNCLDLTLLYAACLEAVGLHPLLIFTEGHAFVGVWLIEETFSESVQDDISLLTKRIAPGINEICLIEATYLNEGQTARFDEASARANQHLHDPDKFDCIVDVKRARAGGIRPLPLRTEKSGGWELEAEPVKSEHEHLAPELMDVLEKPIEVDTIPISRQKQWERRLLDLSLRNTLINFKLTKSSIQIMTTQLGELEDELAERGEFEMLPRPSDWQDDLRSISLFQSIRSNHPMEQLLREEFNRKRLRVDLKDNELEKRVVHLYRSARLSLEENGANTLYLALGVLKWYESPASELPRYAPLVLIPVQIIKKLSRSGYIVRGLDEEPQINITLLEMLRQDFGIAIGGLDTLPRDDKGVDLKQIFNVIRHAMLQVPRWDVEESAYLGLFSFGQFVMWNDIRTRSNELAQNKIVASLMANQLQWQQQEEVSTTPLDEQHPGEQLVPISTDSSQLSAIRAAAAGQSFVLHGPPGTGKSQTITNMIANALASGKRVLFVAEKMAALSVVQKRLENIGLGSFCLELHSNKSTKRAVLDQLGAAIDAPRVMPPEQWSKEADRLANLRGELNGYISALHRKQSFGFSLFEAIAGYEQTGTGPDIVVFDQADIGALTPEKITVWRDLVAQLLAASLQCGGLAGHIWRDARVTLFTQSLKSDVEQALLGYGGVMNSVEDALQKMMSILQLSHMPLRYAKVQTLAKLIGLMLSVPDVLPALLQGADAEQTVGRLRRLSQQGERRDQIRQIVVEHFTPEAVQLDAPMLLSEWAKAELKWLLPKLLMQKRIVKQLKAMAAPSRIIQKEQAREHLSRIVQWQEEEKKLASEADGAKELLGSELWNEGQANWQAISEAADWASSLHSCLVEWHGDLHAAMQTKERIAALLEGGRHAFAQHNVIFSQAASLFSQAEGCEQRLSELLHLELDELAAEAGDSSWYGFMRLRAEGWQAHLHELRDWCAWRRIREQAAEAGLSALLIAHEAGQMPDTELMLVYERGLYKSCASYIFDQEELLGSFSGTLFEEKINRFRETDRRFEQLTRQEIAARLSARVPQMSQEAAQSSEAGILQRAIRSGGRAMSIRKLLDNIPNLLPRLTPCMLMSPISVAQYLDPKSPKFDLVIFDEASQVPTAEAVGALARGHQAVIVGDPKQLPPTSFFSKSSEEFDEENEMAQDMESILDDCLALGMYQMHLSWHYRSRHESLIAFSNAHYYDNKLMTFPSPDEPVSSVSWRPVEGYYDRGRTKHNRAEGNAVVAEIVRRLKDEDLRQQSIGVVTFSSVQQTLIEDLLDEALRKEPSLELLLPELPEPIFVKNLENVQGDERDIILFSIGYGPDASGKVSLNFGPLNRKGGWRRLNVAVSRARQEMLVFSTLHAHQLSASRTSAEGVIGLKAFLDYAEKGKQGLPTTAMTKQTLVIPNVHRALAEELTSRGYEVDLYIGSSGYRLDVGIRDPKQHGQYQLGILLDGPMYKDAKTARDRDVLRIQVLEQLGWSLHHLWLPDWWENREAELRKIEKAIENAGTRKQSAATARRETTKPSPHMFVAIPQNPIEEENDSSILSGGAVYRRSTLEPVTFSTEAFYNTGHTLLILEQMKQVIKEEGPISRSLLIKRVLQAWGISRMGAKLERHFEELLAKLNLQRTHTDGMLFLWPEDIEPEAYSGFRIAANETDRRSAEELPAEELANVIKAVLLTQISLPQEDVVKQTVKQLGYARSGSALDKAARNGISCAIERGFAFVNEDGRIVMKDN